MATDPAVPTVHLNGTSKAGLSDQLERASSALNAAMNVMCEGAPNARDYYVQGPEAYGIAVAQHENRLQRVNDVRAEIDRIWAAVEDQGRR